MIKTLQKWIIDNWVCYIAYVSMFIAGGYGISQMILNPSIVTQTETEIIRYISKDEETEEERYNDFYRLAKERTAQLREQNQFNELALQ